MSEREKMREGIAAEYGFALFRAYSEKEAAHFIGVDISTLKRRRRAGKVGFIKQGDRNVRYLGLQIADLIAFGSDYDGGDDAEVREA
jgi:hypothetical protein